MELRLTRNDGQELIVNTDQIKLIEKLPDGETHVVFGADLGRTVKESLEQIEAALGTVKILA